VQVRDIFLSARRHGKYSDRAELVLALSIQMGLRASELAALRWTDIYDLDGSVRQMILVTPAYTRKARHVRCSLARQSYVVFSPIIERDSFLSGLETSRFLYFARSAAGI
jgi:integrase